MMDGGLQEEVGGGMRHYELRETLPPHMNIGLVLFQYSDPVTERIKRHQR